MIYEHYFALTQRPFSIAPNPHFLFACGQYKEALAALEYGMLHRGGFVLLTGEVGTGKTTLCKFLLQSIPQDTEVALVLHPQLDRLELLHLICKEFGLSSDDLVKESQLIERLTEFLLQVYAKGGYSVLIIDEAQHLDESVLELIRLLTNLETHQDKLLQIILLGQPELKARLNTYQLRQLNQRFTARFHLEGLQLSQVSDYLKHRLDVAGSGASLFSTSAVWLLYRLTKGIPRLINVIADRCLMGCYAEQKKQVSPLMVWRAAKEVLPSKKADSSNRFGWAVATLCLVLIGFNFLPQSMRQNILPVTLNENTADFFTSSSVNDNTAEQYQKSAPSNPCQQTQNCWFGELPMDIVISANLTGQVFINGQWQGVDGQSLMTQGMNASSGRGKTIAVALNDIDSRYIDRLIKPSQQDALIPWVRELLVSQNTVTDGDDFSQWQVITPDASDTRSTNTERTYDVILHEMVKAFQQRHGLMVDGVLGPQTLISLSLLDQQSNLAAQ